MAVATGAVVLGILDAEDAADFPRAVCRAIHDHMHDVRRVSMGQYHPRLRRYRASYWPPMRPEVEQRLLTSYGADLAEHPLLGRGADPGTDDVVTWHDLPPEHPFFRTGLYRDFYLPQGVTDQLSVTVTGPEDVTLVISVDRVAGSFTDPEKDLLRTVRRCLESIFRPQFGSHLGAVLRSVGWTRIVADPSGEVVGYDAPEGQPILAPGASLTDAPWWADVRAVLEQDVVLHGSTTPQVRTVVSGDTTLMVEQSLMNDPVIHLLGHPDKPAATAPRRLTRRQVDVARLLVDGRSAREIAGHLHISLATARSHIEHVYRRLEVTNRAQAVALLLTSAELE